VFDDLDSFDAIGLAELVARREVSAQAWVLRSLERIEALNPILNAVIDIWAARALGIAARESA
jgi:amidase